MKTPCQQGTPDHMDLWTSKHADDRRLAADMCAPCPIRVQCGTDAILRGEGHGVWGGKDLSKNDALTGRRAKAHQEVVDAATEVDGLIEHGASKYEVLRAMKTSPAALAKRMYRAGRPDLGRAFDALSERKKGECPDCGAETSEQGLHCRRCSQVARQPKWRESFMGEAS